MRWEKEGWYKPTFADNFIFLLCWEYFLIKSSFFDVGLYFCIFFTLKVYYFIVYFQSVIFFCKVFFLVFIFMFVIFCSLGICLVFFFLVYFSNFSIFSNLSFKVIYFMITSLFSWNKLDDFKKFKVLNFYLWMLYLICLLSKFLFYLWMLYLICLLSKFLLRKKEIVVILFKMNYYIWK